MIMIMILVSLVVSVRKVNGHHHLQPCADKRTKLISVNLCPLCIPTVLCHCRI